MADTQKNPAETQPGVDAAWMERALEQALRIRAQLVGDAPEVEVLDRALRQEQRYDDNAQEKDDVAGPGLLQGGMQDTVVIRGHQLCRAPGGTSGGKEQPEMLRKLLHKTRSGDTRGGGDKRANKLQEIGQQGSVPVGRSRQQNGRMGQEQCECQPEEETLTARM